MISTRNSKPDLASICRLSHPLRPADNLVKACVFGCVHSVVLCEVCCLDVGVDGNANN
jgi:hypothetical protein